MDQKLYEPDPDGDTLLTLDISGAPFAIWPTDEEWTPLPERRKQAPQDHPCPFDFESVDTRGWQGSSNFNGTLQFTIRPATTTSEFKRPPRDRTPSSIQLRLSSRHLILASPYFKAALQGPWKESTASGTCFELHAEDWNPDALQTVMNIIHGHPRSVPRSVGLVKLAKIAAIVDYYEFHEAVEVFSDMWIEKLSFSSTEYNRDLILWLFISWVFSHAKIFKEVTRIILLKARGPIPTLGLRIPQTVSDQLEKKRQELVKGVLDILHELLIYLRERRTICAVQCTIVLYGLLEREMQTWGLSPQPELPLLGYNFEDTVKLARQIKSPTWAESSRNGYNGYQNHSCNISQLIVPMVDSLEKKLEGLDLEDFQYPGNAKAMK